MEQKQTLGQLTVVQALGLQHIGSYCLVVAFSHQRLDALAVILLADGIKLLIESKLRDIVEILLLEISSGFVIVGIDEGKHVLEHATGSTRGRNKLYHLLALGLVLLPSLDKVLALSVVGGNDDATDGSGSL